MGANRRSRTSFPVPMRTAIIGLGLAAAAMAPAQVTDLVTAFDAGSRSLGSGGALRGSAADPSAAHANPANLAYIDRPMAMLGYRNLPRNRSRLTGFYDDMRRESVRDNGSQRLTEFGAAVPLRRGGTLGISYTIGGHLDEIAAGPLNGAIALAPGVNLRDFRERRKVRNDFLNLSYGRTDRSGNVAFGFGLVLATQQFELSQTGTLVDGNGQPIGGGAEIISLPDVDRRGQGFGVTAGVSVVPGGDPNRSIWASVRSPIDVGGSGTAGYRTIPGRLSLGGAIRTPGLGLGERDYAIFAAQGDLLFGGRGSTFFDPGNPAAIGAGIEYHYTQGFGRIPLRLGYVSSADEGDGFVGRSAFTYGIGYVPRDGRFSLDVNFSKPERGGTDTAVTLTYKF